MNKVIMFVISLFLFSNPCFDFGNAFAEHNKLWSVDFSGLSIADALSTISNKSGIEIVLDGKPSEKVLTKSYKEMPVEEVLMDLLRDESFAALLNYNDHMMISINIWVFQKSNTPSSRMNLVNRIHGNRNIKAQTLNRQQTNNGAENIIGKSFEIPASKTKRISTSNNKKTISTRIISNIRNGHNKKIEHDGSVTPEVNTESREFNERYDDAPPFPDNVRFGGLEPPPMPPSMTLND